ncbi:TIR domain-containing adapter molecule 2 [Varanus komodoensis]|uniref:TIR domain-containing adapter molecule 2 n=1 Tax=Varanus komodoensis TaxID=61221 RepID=UPI001CF7A317|nr:TIR domain-containing adapter molecule 2 [Varanus komodoensis]XP_044302005.1 TIR domain-containing adapter molecule 2 [Varanus komodoensis]
MGTGISKIMSTLTQRNSMKYNSTCKGQKNFKRKPALCELSLDTETTCPIQENINIQETQNSDEEAEDIFYRFVILHADDDVAEAVRVQDLLENRFCIKPGIIFAEMPSGRHLLENLNDAMNGSAWIIILLTENFLSELWCQFQSYTSLFGALTIPHKCSMVIPMRPRNNPLPWERTPLILQAINALQEDSPGFAEQVKKTFQESRYKQQQAVWRYSKKGKAQKQSEW